MKKIAKIASAISAWAALGVGSAFAQTTTSTTTTPGIPNTGAGGDVFANLLLLGISAAVMLAGIVYIARTRTTH